ncbi:ATP-dependent RNA helicase ddx25 [Gryganskiella cystojenkinii]|nr:ATP-dependent RNA helicase ddx25 [Gryganskiella cystojenkinii]
MDSSSSLALTLDEQLSALQYEVVVTQNDPGSPLHSISSFEDLELKDELLKGVYNMNYVKPSKIQAHALPLLMRHPPENLIAQS